MKKKGVIYKITNDVDDRIYIGSSVNFSKRKREHLRKLKNGTHNNPHLLRFVNKYGLNSIQFVIIDETEDDKILSLEQKYIDELKPQFNISKFSSAPMKGRKHSKESLKKMSRPGELNPNFGKRITENTRLSLRKAQTGRIKTKTEINRRIQNLPNRKPVYAVNNFMLIEEDSIAEMGAILNVSQQSISSALNRKNKCRGFEIHPQPELIEMLKSL